MAWVSTWIFASAKSTSRPFIQIFLTSSNGIGGPPGSVDCCSGRAPSSRSRGWPEYRGPLERGQCDNSAMELPVASCPLPVVDGILTTGNGHQATVIFLRADV